MVVPSPYLISSAGSWNGGQLRYAVHETSERLAAHGIAPGDRVLLRGENSPAYVIVLLALAQLDTSLVLVDHGQPWADTRTAAARARARWLLHDDRAVPAVPDTHTLYYPGLTPPAGHSRGPVRYADDRRAPEVTLDSWWRRPDAAVLWSSGTTGEPKGVVKSGSALLDNAQRTQQVMRYRVDDLLAPWLPFSHQYGLSVVLLWWLTGAGLLVAPCRRIDRAAEDVVRWRATVVDAPPSTYYTLLRLLARRPALAERLADVRYWGVGGAPLPRPLAAEFVDRLGAPLLDGYGTTEVGNVALATPDNPVGCGRPLPGVEVRVRRTDGTPAPPGVQGELEVRSSGLMAGYLGPDGTAAGHDTWYATGDLGHLDEVGNVHVAGRRHAVHRHGYTLYPESIERRAEAACERPLTILTTPDQRRGTSLIFVVADPAGRTARHWRDRLCTALPEHEHPNRVCVVRELPVTPVGKIDSARLRAQIQVTELPSTPGSAHPAPADSATTVQKGTPTAAAAVPRLPGPTDSRLRSR